MSVTRVISLNNGIQTEVVPATTSVGAGSAGQIVALNASGLVDTTMVPPSAVTISTTSLVTVAGLATYYLNNGTGAITFNLPTITTAKVGSQFCFRNATGKSGAITIKAPAATYIDKDGANGAAAGTVVSSGALGDSICLVAISTTQYVAYVQKGTWVNS